MGSYVEDVLVPGEHVLHLGRTSLWTVAHLIALGAILLPAFGIGLLIWLLVYIKIRSTELAVTSRRLIVKHGFITRRTVEINLGKIESLEVHQGLMGRLLNFGTLVVSGSGMTQAPITGLADPLTFRRMFVDAQSPEKSNNSD